MPFPFAEVCILLQRHEEIETRQPPILKRAERESRRRAVTESWFKSHRSAIGQLDVDSSVALLSALLPERRTDRVYNIKSTRLVHTLSRCLGLSSWRTKDLHAYNRPGHGDLAQCLERVLTTGGPPARPPVTLEEVDGMLQVLAGGCIFSDPAVQRLPPGSSETRDALIGNILKRLHPREAKWLVRLILKDFTPVQLDETEILRGYHFLLPGILRFQDRFDAAVTLLKGALNDYPSHPDPRSERLHFQSAAKYLQPTVGIKVGRPNFHKARGIDHCLGMMGESRWVLERKYDGEYCEVHIDLSRSPDPTQCIRIFSKSGKDSTQDRKGLHSILLDALKLGRDDCKIKRQAILLGEVVVFSDSERRILPFDEIRKQVLRSGRAIGTDADSHPKEGEHLAIVFFDLLLLDDEIVMSRPVEERRQWLREIYRKIGGRAIGAEWKTVDFSKGALAKRILMQQFAASIAQRCEGLVLKPCGVPYFSLEAIPTSYACSFIKLKKDYMVGIGDEADFAVVGGSYNAQHAASSGIRGLRWTEFHLACLVNKADVLRFDARPRFKVVGGIEQEHCIPGAILQAANALGKFCAAPYATSAAPKNFDIDLSPGTKMDVVFNTPFVFEVLGSGFEKPSNCNFFMLRHARVRKLHEDRTWRDAVSMQELQQQAAAARSAAADSESQETRRWLEKLERKSRRKFERERTGTPKARTTATPSTAVATKERMRDTTPIAVRQASSPRTAAPSALDGTTLIAASPSSSSKRRRGEPSQTPCPKAKRQRTEPVPHSLSDVTSAVIPLADITNQAPNLSASRPSSEVKPSFLKRLSSIFSPSPNPSIPGLASRRGRCVGSSCPLRNSTLHLAPCIKRTPYITVDLLAPHIESGCACLTSSLAHWKRDACAHALQTETVSESPSYTGRRKVLLVEGRRREATAEVISGLSKLNDGKGLKERVEIWDWRGLELGESSQGGEAEGFQKHPLGILKWNVSQEKVVLESTVDWLREAYERLSYQ